MRTNKRSNPVVSFHPSGCPISGPRRALTRVSPVCELPRVDYELVKIHHPDACHGLDPAISHERFQRIQQAYNFLRNPKKRSSARGVGVNYAAYRYAPQKAPDGSTRTWTGQMNEWGGFKYQYDHEFNPTAKKPGAASEERKTEKIFHEEDTFYWVFGAVVSTTACCA